MVKIALIILLFPLPITLKAQPSSSISSPMREETLRIAIERAKIALQNPICNAAVTGTFHRTNQVDPSAREYLDRLIRNDSFIISNKGVTSKTSLATYYVFTSDPDDDEIRIRDPFFESLSDDNVRTILHEVGHGMASNQHGVKKDLLTSAVNPPGLPTVKRIRFASVHSGLPPAGFYNVLLTEACGLRCTQCGDRTYYPSHPNTEIFGTVFFFHSIMPTSLVLE